MRIEHIPVAERAERAGRIDPMKYATDFTSHGMNNKRKTNRAMTKFLTHTEMIINIPHSKMNVKNIKSWRASSDRFKNKIINR